MNFINCILKYCGYFHLLILLEGCDGQESTSNSQSIFMFIFRNQYCVYLTENNFSNFPFFWLDKLFQFPFKIPSPFHHLLTIPFLQKSSAKRFSTLSSFLSNIREQNWCIMLQRRFPQPLLNWHRQIAAPLRKIFALYTGIIFTFGMVMMRKM